MRDGDDFPPIEMGGFVTISGDFQFVNCVVCGYPATDGPGDFCDECRADRAAAEPCCPGGRDVGDCSCNDRRLR